MNDIKKVIGIALKRARKHRGYLQKDIGNTGIVSREHLVGLENGRYSPSTELLSKLLDFYQAEFEITIKLK
jgi:transcriptional regulator with XRE-family HTH domain